MEKKSTNDKTLEKQMYSQCSGCANLKDAEARTCSAYPEGIPVDLWYNRTMHTEPFPGDGGIVRVQREA